MCQCLRALEGITSCLYSEQFLVELGSKYTGVVFNGSGCASYSYVCCWTVL